MFYYKKYLIKTTDRFDPAFFSFVDDEVALILEQTKHIDCDQKAEIIVGFLKEHSVPVGSVQANPELVQMVRSKSLSSGNIESLFESCYNNPAFGLQLETYIKSKMAG